MSDRCRINFLREVPAVYPKTKTGSLIHVLGGDYLRTFSAVDLSLVSSKSTTPDMYFDLMGSVAVGKGYIYAHDNPGTLYRVNISTGSITTTNPLSGLNFDYVRIVDLDEATFVMLGNKTSSPYAIHVVHIAKATGSVLSSRSLPLDVTQSRWAYALNSAFIAANGDIYVGGQPFYQNGFLSYPLLGISSDLTSVKINMTNSINPGSEPFTNSRNVAQHRTDATTTSIFGNMNQELRQLYLTEDPATGSITKTSYATADIRTLGFDGGLGTYVFIYGSDVIGDTLFVNFDYGGYEGQSEVIAMHWDNWNLLYYSTPPATELRGGLLAAEWE